VADKEQVRQSYASVADLYIEQFGASDKVHPDDLAFIGRHLGGQTGPVLDLGCGPGHMAGYLHALGADAVGLDMVPEFIAHARAAHPEVSYELGSYETLDVPDGSVAGILTWYSLIHLPPQSLHGVLTEFRRAISPAGKLVLGFFEGPVLTEFDHKVVTGYSYPADEMSTRLARAGFTEVERLQRPHADDPRRGHGVIAATTAGR
jgi:SAM-dependent methyltransferase